MNDQLDVIGIGNAMVDIIILSTKEEIENFALKINICVCYDASSKKEEEGTWVILENIVKIFFMISSD